MQQKSYVQIWIDVHFQHLSEHTLLFWSPVTGLQLDHGQETRSHKLVRHLEQSTPAEEKPENAHCCRR
jgi:hypothetical protein